MHNKTEDTAIYVRMVVEKSLSKHGIKFFKDLDTTSTILKMEHDLDARFKIYFLFESMRKMKNPAHLSLARGLSHNMQVTRYSSLVRCGRRGLKFILLGRTPLN